MGWAMIYIRKLAAGETVKLRPTGSSMTGLIESGQLCTVMPLDRAPEVGDIVLCKVRGAEYLHLVKAVRNGQYQIGSNKGRINGWVTSRAIYGRCVGVED